ncbi:MAG: hypothetical protein KKF50_01510 [Nanoarchaeota archaeon]|nr:hypothetical protein [Nanoarchaeota archaeon]
MRDVTRRKLIWIVFVIVIVWLLAFVLTRFFLPAIVEVPELESAQAIRSAVTSGVVLGTLTTLMVIIIGAIVVDSIIARARDG